MIMEYVTLNNGVKMPMIGIGTFLLQLEDAEATVFAALVEIKFLKMTRKNT